MSLLKTFLGIDPMSADTSADSESKTVRRITADLERLPKETSHYLAAFAYVLARVANADLRIEDEEIEAMVRATHALGHLEDDEARLVVEIARLGNQDIGGSENYLVTREFRRISTREQRLGLVECLYAVAAADGTISTQESSEVLKIADELGLSRNDANALRAGWKQHLAEFQGLPSRSS